jgi:O-acetyl-ADP-ribose deacetylase (regulator of RNase III)
MGVIMSTINYIKGDVLSPIGDGKKIIMHVVNNLGGWGKGFVVSLSKKWQEPENQYRKWYASKQDFNLGSVQFIEVDPGLYVANMLAQHGYRYNNSNPPVIKMSNLESCLRKVYTFAQENNLSIHAPKIGAGLAGLDWQDVEELIEKTFSDTLKVNIYIL